MRLSRLETLIVGLIASMICLALVILAGILVYSRGQGVEALPGLLPSVNAPQEVRATATWAPLPMPSPPLMPMLPASPTPAPLPAPAVPVGVLNVDYWTFDITEARSMPGINSSRQNVVLLGNVTNNGAATDTFVASFELQDSQGRRYEDDVVSALSLEAQFGAENPSSMNPGITRRVIVVYDAPIQEKTFTLVPNILVASWSGNLTFTLP